MGNKTVLVVDDEKKILELVRLYLENEGFKVITAEDGETALEKVEMHEPQIVILDIMLPKLDGWEVCRKIREKSAVPIIMLTARGEEIDRILGLELGADDYVSKPFSPRELVARVKAVLRRYNNTDKKQRQRITLDNLLVDYDYHVVKINGKRIDLSPKEFELLWLLINNRNRVLSREQLLANVWDYDYYGDPRTVDTHIKRLREKLGDKCGGYIKTVWGVGYKFEVERDV